MCVVCFAVSLRSRYVHHEQLYESVVACVVGARREDDIESKALFGVVACGLYGASVESMVGRTFLRSRSSKMWENL